MVSKAYPTSWWGQKSILPQYDTTAVVSYLSIFNIDSVRKAPRGLLSISYKVKKSTTLLWHNRGCVTSTQSAKLFQQKDAQLSAPHFSQSRIIIWPTVTQPRLCHKYPTGKVSSSKLIRRAPKLQIKVTVAKMYSSDTTAVVSLWIRRTQFFTRMVYRACRGYFPTQNLHHPMWWHNCGCVTIIQNQQLRCQKSSLGLSQARNDTQ